MNYIFCGLQGSGKSTFGRVLAKEYAYSFIDTDIQVLRQYALYYTPPLFSCHEIVMAKGETVFRELEKQATMQLHPDHSAMIALGGGTLSPYTYDHLLSLGKIIYLYMSREAFIKECLLRHPPPSYLNMNDIEGSARHVFHTRCALYESAADVVFDVSEDNMLDRIRNWLNEQK